VAPRDGITRSPREATNSCTAAPGAHILGLSLRPVSPSPSRPFVSFSLLLESVSALSLVCGLIFAALQLRDAQRARVRASRLEMVRSFQSPQFVRGLAVIAGLPEGLSADETEARLSAEERDLVLLVVANWESVGVLLYRGDLTLELVSDFFGGCCPSPGDGWGG
jgi:hypothetical protein